MKQELTLDAFIQRLKSKPLTDKRTGQNVQYAVNDAAQAAFAIFFMQRGSFLAGQRIMPLDFWTIKMAVLSSQMNYEKKLFTPIQGKSRTGNPARRKEHQSACFRIWGPCNPIEVMETESAGGITRFVLCRAEQE